MEIVIPTDPRKRAAAKNKARGILYTLDVNKAWRVTIDEYKPTRSNQQNRYLWGVVYPTILESSEELRGWDDSDLHTFFLGEHFGWTETEGFGKKKIKPIRTSSKLSKTEFVDYVDYIHRFMAERGVVIPDPDEQM